MFYYPCYLTPVEFKQNLLFRFLIFSELNEREGSDSKRQFKASQWCWNPYSRSKPCKHFSVITEPFVVFPNISHVEFILSLKQYSFFLRKSWYNSVFEKRMWYLRKSVCRFHISDEKRIQVRILRLLAHSSILSQSVSFSAVSLFSNSKIWIKRWNRKLYQNV